MEIKALNLSKLRNNAHFEFHNEVKVMINNETPEHLNIAEAFPQYLSLIEQADKGLEVIKQNDLTKQLSDADVMRDISFRGVADNVKSLTKHFNPEVQKAASGLSVLFDSYGNVTKQSYNEETSALYNLTDDLLTNYADALAACRLTEWVEVLQKQNEDFRRLMATRNEAIAENEPINMKEVRKELDATYRQIVKRIEASALLNGDADYKEFVAKLNKRIIYYKEHNM